MCNSRPAVTISGIYSLCPDNHLFTTETNNIQIFDCHCHHWKISSVGLQYDSFLSHNSLIFLLLALTCNKSKEEIKQLKSGRPVCLKHLLPVFVRAPLLVPAVEKCILYLQSMREFTYCLNKWALIAAKGIPSSILHLSHSFLSHWASQAADQSCVAYQ